MDKKVVVITGSSRGIGYHTALNLAEKGYRVYGTMRYPEGSKLPDEVVVKQLDVTDPESIRKAVSEIIKKEGRIDVLVNNAGYALFSPVDLVSDKEVSEQFDVNVYGVLRMMRAVIPQMRKQKSGRIVNISSLAGITSNIGMGIYCATKHAVEALSQSLAATLHPWNIHVSVVEPGSTATEFFESTALPASLSGENPYGDFVSRYSDRVKEFLSEGQPPEEVAEVIAQVIKSEKPDFRYQTSENGEKVAANTLVEPTGNQWVEDQIEKFGDWFK